MKGLLVFAIPLLLACIGALIALAKVLLSNDPLTPRLIVGTCILGAATSAIAGGILHFVPNLAPAGVVALGCVFGLLGHLYVEDRFKDYFNNKTK